MRKENPDWTRLAWIPALTERAVGSEVSGYFHEHAPPHFPLHRPLPLEGHPGFFPRRHGHSAGAGDAGDDSAIHR